MKHLPNDVARCSGIEPVVCSARYDCARYTSLTGLGAVRVVMMESQGGKCREFIDNERENKPK